MDEAKLIEKLRLIEALHAGAMTEGERVAAEHARDRMLERLEALAAEDPPVEYRFTLGDMWSRRLFLALLRRYELTPYRYKGQRYTTVMVQVSKSFVDQTLWPEFTELDETLNSYLSDVTERIISQGVHGDFGEASEMASPPLLTTGKKEAAKGSGPVAPSNSEPDSSQTSSGAASGTTPSKAKMATFS